MKGYFLVDFIIGKVIVEGEVDIKLVFVSLIKMMISYVIGIEIKVGNILLIDMVIVSEKVWVKNFFELLKMFIEVGK